MAEQYLDKLDLKDIDENIKWAKINEDVIRSVQNPRASYWMAFAFCSLLLAIGLTAEVYQYRFGIGWTGLNWPNMWGLYIASFVFWIGMSHSGTLLSAILHIVQADWRKPIYRFAEAMTTFTLMTAMLFPVLHAGRLWNIYWTLPYLSDRGIWPNFRSPLIWDAFAVFTYLTSSALFLYIGSVPDLAICRDNTTGWRRKLYQVMSLGWQGTDKQWRHFRKGYMIMACFLIPLAVSVHSIVSADFSMSWNPGWHVTTYPPYFVAGALYSGCAGIMTLFILLRHFFRFEKYMTISIFEKNAKLTFAIAMVWTYLNLIEFASTWYGHDVAAKEVLWAKFTGVYAPIFWSMMFIGSVLPFTLAFQKLRRNLPLMFIISIVFNIGMWMERLLIIEPTLSYGYEPSVWHGTWPSVIMWGIVLGSIGWFGLLFLIFVKIIPSMSMYEVKEMVYHRKAAEEAPPMTLPSYALPGFGHHLTGGGAVGPHPAASKGDPEGGGV